jgi:hypothetical protein
MDPKNKFTAETVQQLRQSLDEVPPYQATELSKQQTLRTLSPQILALHAKGYSWAAVAAMLAERGLPVSVAALRTYLRRVRAEAENGKPRTTAKRSRDLQSDTRQPERPAPTPRAPAPSGETPPVAKPPQPGASTASPVAGQRTTTPGTPREQEPRRSAFAVRPDTRDI